MSNHRRFLVPMIITTIVAVALILPTCSTNNTSNVSTVDSRCLIYQVGSCPYRKPVQMSSLTTAPTTSTTTTVDLSFLNTTTTTSMIVPKPVENTARNVPVPEYRNDHSDRWDQLAQCEAGGNWTTNTGNGFGGGLQFMHGNGYSTWLSFGGGEFAAHPWEATREQQIEVAARVLNSVGWNAWPGCSRKLGFL